MHELPRPIRRAAGDLGRESGWVPTWKRKLAEPATVYRAFDEVHTLLYVGVTKTDQMFMRFYVHHHEGSGWVKYTRSMTFEPFETRESAREAELTAIRTENPIWNIAEKPYGAGEAQIQEYERDKRATGSA